MIWEEIDSLGMIGPNSIIYCENLDDADLVLEELVSLGYKWGGGLFYKNEKDLCFRVNISGVIRYGEKGFYETDSSFSGHKKYKYSIRKDNMLPPESEEISSLLFG